MVKVQSQSGNSLADQYDVQGSIAGIEQLETRELPIVHDLAPVLFSERLGAAVRRVTSGDILQSTAFDLLLTDLPAGISRIVGLSVITDNPARVADCIVTIQQDDGDREIPIFIWDSNEDSVSARIIDDGAAATSFAFLTSNLNLTHLPTTLVGTSQPRRMSRIALRGVSTAFGAGTVVVTALLHILLTHLGGDVPSNRGVLVPSW